jgi:hypothetical protein
VTLPHMLLNQRRKLETAKLGTTVRTETPSDVKIQPLQSLAKS